MTDVLVRPWTTNVAGVDEGPVGINSKDPSRASKRNYETMGFSEKGTRLSLDQRQENDIVFGSLGPIDCRCCNRGYVLIAVNNSNIRKSVAGSAKPCDLRLVKGDNSDSHILELRVSTNTTHICQNVIDFRGVV